MSRSTLFTDWPVVNPRRGVGRHAFTTAAALAPSLRLLDHGHAMSGIPWTGIDLSVGVVMARSATWWTWPHAAPKFRR